jgi:hypothetical protein
MYDNHRINSATHPQVIVVKVDFLREFQISQGHGKGECDIDSVSNDVLSLSVDQAVAMARKILELVGE